MSRKTPVLSRRPRALSACAACLAVTLGVSACHDAAGEPLAAVVTPESRPALLVEGLPSLPDLIGRAGMEAELTGAVDLWLGSWDLEGEAGAQRRGRAYDEAAGPLLAELGPAALHDAIHGLDGALRGIDGLPAEDLSPAMAERIDEAADLHERALAILEQGSRAEALALTLRGADVLRSIGPEGVARVLTARAQRALDEGTAGASAEADRDRGERLLQGARLALREGDWSRAAQRAYYACQVLGVSPN